jgi:hypothetical protein
MGTVMSLCGSGGKEDVEPASSPAQAFLRQPDEKKIGSIPTPAAAETPSNPDESPSDSAINQDESLPGKAASNQDVPLVGDNGDVPSMAPKAVTHVRLTGDPKWPPSPLGKPAPVQTSSRLVAGLKLDMSDIALEEPSSADTLETVNAAEPPSPIPAGIESLQDPEILASLPREELRNRIGTELYPLVEKDLVEVGESDTETVRRVTGMLLETDDECQLLQLIANSKRRKSATGEALQIILSKIHKQPLTQARLEPFGPARQKNIIGEHLYPLVEAELTRPRSGSQPELAGRVTGMLLHDGESSELLAMLEQEEGGELQAIAATDDLTGTEDSLLHHCISQALELLQKEGEIEEQPKQ